MRASKIVRKFLSQEQTKRLSEAYIMFTFKYCPLIWMFGGKTKNKSITKIHKRTLRLIYDTEDGTIIHEDNIQTLLAVIYKSIHYISSTIMRNFFWFKEKYPQPFW